jgi:lysophospholipase L1-like esterase
MLGLLLALPLPLRAAEPLTLKDGDRVILVGSTSIERAQRYGYWETSWTSRFPDKNVTFRNLGWSGDSVFGDARAAFDPPEVGFRRLKERVQIEKPTVILVGYGLNESFAGEAGLPRFQQGLNTFLDVLAETKARVILLSPMKQEDVGRPFPDPTENNRKIGLYRDALKQAAEKRQLGFIDLTDLPGDTSKGPHWTDNGLHLTAYGYRKAGQALDQRLGLAPRHWKLTIDKDGKVAESEGMKIAKAEALHFEATDAELPTPPAPVADKGETPERVLKVTGLPAGKHELRIDGQPIVIATAEEWAAGVPLTHGPEFDQVEKLRSTIIEKNREYFYRWRPQNETYLFGFRKHEQGQNAKEIAEFDPIVAKLEEDIAKLRVPVSHRYEIVPAK